MVPVHPLLVHIPAGLVFSAAVFYFLDFILEKKTLADTAFWMLLSGTAGCVLAIVSGNLAESDLVMTREIAELSGLHETLAMVAGWLCGILFVWQLLRRNQQPKWEKALFVLAMWLSLAVLAIAAHMGGRIVYEKGGGVEPMRKPLEQEKRLEEKQQNAPGTETVMRMEFRTGFSDFRA